MKTGINRKKLLSYLIVISTIFVLTFIMTRKELLPVHSDVRAHMKHSLSLDLVLSSNHGGWSFVCWLFYACLPVSPETAACMANSLFNALTGALVLWLCCQMLPETLPGTLRDQQKKWLPAAVSIAALLAGPLFLRFYNRFYYLGQGSPNPWHNPTYIGVRPFMVLITVLTVRYWKMTKNEKVTVRGRTLPAKTVMQLLLAALLACSTFVKPSFLTIYLPACMVLVFIRLVKILAGKNDGSGTGSEQKNPAKLVLSMIADHLYFVPSGILLLWQYTEIYRTAETVTAAEAMTEAVTEAAAAAAAKSSGIAISLFEAAGRYAPSVALSWVLRMAFPAAVILIWWKKIRKQELFPLVIAEYIFGQLIAFIFIETGSRATHGNFGWGNLLGTSLIWIFCLLYFTGEYLSEQSVIRGWRRRLKYLVPALLLFWHLSAGIMYYISLLHTPDMQL